MENINKNIEQYYEYIFWNSVKINSKSTLKIIPNVYIPRIYFLLSDFVSKKYISCDCIKMLKSIFIDNENTYLYDILETSIRCNFYEIGKYLFDHVNFVIKDNFLKTAIIFKSDNMIKLLIEHGADISNDNYYLLDYSVRNNNIDLLKFLFKHDIDVNVKERYPFLLLLAIKNENLNIIKYLIKNGYPYEFEKDYIMCYTIKYGNKDIIKFLRCIMKINILEFIRLKILVI